jgi:DNA repair protein RecN (Recombination protein N)
MLRELHIQNLAVIERANIEFVPGLNVFTGETGAGKSLIIGAFELLLGLRSGGRQGAAVIRAGADEARITGLFDIASPELAHELGVILDRPIPDDEPLLITRRLFATGRSSVSVNGEPATASLLREVGQRLVDIHGQYDQQYLLRPVNQLAILDAFGQCDSARARFAGIYHELSELRRRLAELTETRGFREHQIELFTFQADEIDEASPEPGEYAKLRERYAMLSNLGTLQADTAQVCQSLTDGDTTIDDKLSSLETLLADLAKLDTEHLAPLSETLTDAREMLRDVSRGLGRYLDSLDLDPAELSQVENRLDTLNSLIHKYAKHAANVDDPLDAVVAFRADLATKLEALTGDDADLTTLRDRIDTLQEELSQAGVALTKLRRKAGKKLRPLVESQLAELGMAEATFDVQITSLKPDDPNVTASGLDIVELMICPNPGQATCPLRDIASGGELSRIMLGLKSILASNDRVSVMVFDEIDANIGGRLGAIVGRKMRQLAHATDGDAHQVLCITHLPQIAAFADRHLHIEKTIDGDDTRTCVQPLDGVRRLAELAEMISGKAFTDASLAQAQDLLDTATLDAPEPCR